MVNFTVSDLDAMLAQLRAAGVEVDDKIEDHEFGRFGWAVDPEGNRFELWDVKRRTGANSGSIRPHGHLQGQTWTCLGKPVGPLQPTSTGCSSKR